MGWLSGEAYQAAINKCKELSKHDVVTWEEATKAIPADTLAWAEWSGCRRWAEELNKSPQEALIRYIGNR